MTDGIADILKMVRAENDSRDGAVIHPSLWGRMHEFLGERWQVWKYRVLELFGRS